MTEKSSKIRFFNIWVILVFDLILRVAGDFQADALMALKNSLVDPDNVLEGWSASLSDPCVWLHVTCLDHSVTHIELGDANLSGQLAIELGQLSNLQYLELYGNNITGAIPEQLGNLTELESLDLYSNKLSGSIPTTLGNLKKLQFLRLNNNNLSGEVPRSLTTISTLVVLDLSRNHLTGSIPTDGSFVRFTTLSFSGNNLTSPPPSLLPPTSPTPSGTRNRNTGVIAAGVAAGAGLLFVVLCIVLVWQRRRKRRDNSFFDVAGEQDPEVHVGQLKRFSLHELLVASDHFNNKNLVGKGGFGKVYKARLADGSLVAIKRLLEVRTQGGELQFQNEVELIGMAVHRNLLRLCGFCMTPTERLLIYPYMANGSLASYLRERKESQPPLDWPKRKNIALGSARGLAYLHDHCDPKIIHRDVKADNILLDDEFEAVIGDFGLAKLMDYKETFVTTAIHGTPGHIAPEYLSTGKSSVKVDVFGYGIMLLELITGQRAPELAQLASENDDLRFEWVKGLLKEKKLDTIVDANLEGNYVVEEVEQLTQVALLCTQSSPMERPYMSEVIRMLQGDGLAERWEEREKEEMFRQDNYNYRSYNQTDTDWVIGDTITNVENESLSGPR